MIRLLDIFFTLFAILLLWPLFIFIIILIKLESKGPAVFRQKRTGLNKKVFTIYKFRSMKYDHSDNGLIQSVKDDQRHTKIGRLLRKLSVDELPQLLNILKGDMSICGPRPHAIVHDDIFSKKINNYDLRFRARPGLTGLAQANGFRGEIKELKDMQKRIDFDNFYIDNMSIYLYLKVIYLTVFTVIFRHHGH